jgi:tetratricopeptide (TPR) repeat protein
MFRLYRLLLFLLSFTHAKGQARQMDTLVDVAGYKIHFHIVKGKGIPILFEAGGGNDGTVWNDLLQPIATITEATLITYDRVGLGKSTHENKLQSVIVGTNTLEAALIQLGYNGDIILVAHSRGALYATLYTARHPEKVKMAVLIDGSSACDCRQNLTTLNGQDPVLKTLSIPVSVPVMALVSYYTPFYSQPGKDGWKGCHQDFVAEASNRIGIVAYGCGHYIFKDNPALVINVIAEAYSKIVNKDRSGDIARRGLMYAIEGANELKKKETDYRNSEDDLNTWGYSLLGEGKMQEALKVFQLNVILYPLSWNVYDSYGEALLKNGQKEDAIKMYQKSVELNPSNDNGKNILKQNSN